MKYILHTLMVSVFVLGGVFIAVPHQAEAACSYPGYINSRGYCVVSYSNANQNRYRYTTYSHSAQYDAYQRQIDILERYISRIELLIERYKDLQANLDTRPYYYDRDNEADVAVTTRSATDINDEEATLRGEIDWNGEDEATVYFEFGRSSGDLRYETTHVVLDENDDDEEFEHTITNLREDTKYYFRAVAEDENGDEDYGRILSFTTDEGGSSSDDDYPEVDVDSATSISDDSARLRGDVDMNDFHNGVVFFVYGEDEDQVKDIEDDYDTYSEVDEDGDDLQKIRVDSDLDNDASYYANINGGLDNDTDIYFNLCVEFEDEDDDDRIVCGDTEDFTTDN